MFTAAVHCLRANSIQVGLYKICLQLKPHHKPPHLPSDFTLCMHVRRYSSAIGREIYPLAPEITAWSLVVAVSGIASWRLTGFRYWVPTQVWDAKYPGDWEGRDNIHPGLGAAPDAPGVPGMGQLWQ